MGQGQTTRKYQTWGLDWICLTILSMTVSCVRTHTPEPATTPETDDAPSATRFDETDIVPGPSTLAALLSYEDTDGDRRITVNDEGARSFSVELGRGTHLIEGTYHLANLVQELFLAHREGRTTISLDHVEEPIIDRISRLIRERYWKNLTRTIDRASLSQVLPDPKMDDARRRGSSGWPGDCTSVPEGLPRFLYVPHTDTRALAHYRGMTDMQPDLVVCRLPASITPTWVQSLSANAEHGSRHGLVSLGWEEVDGEVSPLPYGVPGGRFNEMYGWDSYFHVLGLLQDDAVDRARALVENQLYEVKHYGQVLNANRTYYLTRSQPPLLSSAVRALWPQMQGNRKWLVSAIEQLAMEYDRVWNEGDRTTPLCDSVAGERVCLSTYHAAGVGEPPEVEPGHFDWLYRERAQRLGHDANTYRSDYLAGVLPATEMEALDWFFMHDRSMRESGHDTTYRWTVEGEDRCADFATIDLNALLFKVELDLAYLSKLARLADWKSWCSRAEARKNLVQKYLYDGELFVDYLLDRNPDHTFAESGQRSSYVSATTLYPLWASASSPCTDEGGIPLSLFSSHDQARRLVATALNRLETPGGLVATSQASVEADVRTTPRQWDYPFGWAPHQILAWMGLRQHGYKRDADRLTYRWLYMIAKNAHDFHGTIPEKYDIVQRSHRVFAEYGNVGTEFNYITKEGFGWMNASFQVGTASIEESLIPHLNRLIPPERLFELRP